MRIRGEYFVIWRHKEGAAQFRHKVNATGPTSARRASENQIRRILGNHAEAWAGEHVLVERNAPEWGAVAIGLGFALWLSVLLVVMVQVCPVADHIGGQDYASSSLRDLLRR